MKVRRPSMFAQISRGLRLIYSERSFLAQQGYTESIKQKRPCKPDGTPLPWMNYQVVHFLEQRLRKDHNLFEYGSGYSTQFYARHAGTVTSVEHNRDWYNILNKNKPENVELLFRDIGDINGYCQAIAGGDRRFDIIVVDGRERLQCMEVAVDFLSEQGVVLLDDSSRKRYQDGRSAMKRRGFRELDFIGIKPGGLSTHQTTLFYKENNCLGL
ncbi:class I SAM-dependent methyltransferase [Parahaliea mediterranea]|uniref:Class I SAM-dependent methyltransferase n=1 Tax=Parahaliea mediterranea TaxID=651086 RepID=A0A939IK27_9GAMM|nr:class I SAM-dependent methyltransferase [Parahaliea mediterranea]MBN7798314.1 class I SAM-dependent methyltransferase [Parahaliea mediterranea]